MKPAPRLSLTLLLTVFLAAIFFPISAPAQSIDSLKQQITAGWQSDPTLAIAQSKEISRLAVEAHDLENQAWALNMQGIVFGAVGTFDSSFHYYQLSLDFCRANHIPSVEKKTLMNLAINYQYQGRYEESLQSYLDAIRIFEDSHDTLGLGHAYSGVGGLHWNLGEEKQAVADYLRSIRYYEMLGAEGPAASVYSNLGVLYRDLHQPDSARHWFRRAEGIFLKYDNRMGLISLNVNRAGLYEKTWPDSALYFFGLALQDSREIGYGRGEALASTGLAEQYLLRREYGKALTQGKAALEAAREVEDLGLQKRDFRVLYRASEQKGDLKGAFAWLQQYQLTSDSLLNQEKQKAVAEMEVKFETEKKEKEIAEQEVELARNQARIADQELAISKGNQLIGILVSLAAGLALVGLVIFLYQRNLRRRAQEQLLLQQSLEEARRERALSEEKLRISRELHDNIGSQITFLISSLDNLHYVEQDADTREKLEDLSGFARNAIGDLRHTIWALHQDVTLRDLITKAGDLAQKVSAATSLQVELKEQVTVNPELGSTVAINLLRILQEALQNAARHAAANKVLVEISSTAEQLQLLVSDDGKGFDPDNLQGEGFGLANLRQRAASLGAHLRIDSAPGEGTRVRVEYAFPAGE
ncbi:MAG: sensor histidine kinase [Bacteroidia bacterium]|nr:sensor histidine kinase [Bacteroidia bacterium]